MSKEKEVKKQTRGTAGGLLCSMGIHNWVNGRCSRCGKKK
ncbi:hypothetical protein GCM10011573_23020 [Enterococcus wangshanyuanii]|uniref:Bacteriocin n=1 Tax=Enterococcus wangshanyuanii TaxID=2005703 RepID=A0ABQ1P7W5_9ENTE|nr:hypothetical protein GCM10011573_23020 [Enterococcus wangshanyuanii]